jgi:hypothetical protein
MRMLWSKGEEESKEEKINEQICRSRAPVLYFLFLFCVTSVDF